MDLFQLFTTSNYTFLQFDSGIGGNKIVAEFTGNGIVKLRDNMTQGDGSETHVGNSSVHIRPTESFVAALNGQLVGHGIRINDVQYRIIDQVDGYDYEEDTLAFYKVSMKREEIWEESDLPLT